MDKGPFSLMMSWGKHRRNVFTLCFCVFITRKHVSMYVVLLLMLTFSPKMM